jgi:hypothetical protein
MKASKKNPIVIGLFVLFASLVIGLSGPIAAEAATSPSLGLADSYSVLSGAGATNAGATTITGNVGVSPNNTYTENGVTTFLTAGNPHLNDLSAQNAQLANTAAFTSLDTLNPNADCIGGVYGLNKDLTTMSPLGPGTYCAASFILTGNLNLTGTGVWVFKSGADIITSPGSSITGGDACNIWWRAVSSVTLDTTTAFKGNIWASTAITMANGATLDGRAFAQTAAVTMIGNTISLPVCAVVPQQTSQAGTITVVKTVINDNGRTKTVADFPLFVNGSPVTSGVTNSYTNPVSDPYMITETVDPNYTRSFSGDCASDGSVYLHARDTRVCVVTNNDIGAPVVVPPVPPIIDVVKVPSPLSLPNGPGPVTYTYTLKNIGTVPVTDVTMVGDTCSPIVLNSGDTDADSKLDLTETWVYKCTKTITETHTNTVVATGWANGISATDIASAQVVVSSPLVPPLIHVTKVPNPLTLLAGGGVVTYTEKITNPGTVALSNVTLNDDKCSPMDFNYGDTNNDSKLDVNETWVYTCSTNLTDTTLNTAVAEGTANGYTVRDFAVATVTVASAAPALPQTGVAPSNNGVSWAIIFLAGTFIAVSASLVLVVKKSSI